MTVKKPIKSRRIRRVAAAVLAIEFLAAVVLAAGCMEDDVGACSGFSSEHNRTYCKNGFTKEECDDWNRQQINGVSWNFHAGQSCEDRGTPPTP